MNTTYSNRFLKDIAVESYDSKEYSATSYASCIWGMQKPVLEQVLRDFRLTRQNSIRLLDFACGTGRVLSMVEPLVDAAEGVDISENMVAVARTKCTKSHLIVGDVLANPELLQKEYDVISCFRLLLNLEAELRTRILKRLRDALHPQGLLLVNVHGNSHSLRHPAIVWRRWREQNQKCDVMLNEMSPAEVRALFKACGFQIVRQFGFGILPPTIYRTPLRRVAQAVDQRLAGDRPWNNWSIDMLFICQPL